MIYQRWGLLIIGYHVEPDFRKCLLGFELVTTYGDQAAFISAGGYHHHLGLNTWQSKGAPKAGKKGVGLFHNDIGVPFVIPSFTLDEVMGTFARSKKINCPKVVCTTFGQFLVT